MRDPSGIRPAFYYADDEFIVVCSEAPLIQTVFNVNGDHVFPLPPGTGVVYQEEWCLDPGADLGTLLDLRFSGD